MNNVTAQQFKKDQLAILDLAPVDRKLNLLKLAKQHGLRDLTRSYPSGIVRGYEGTVKFPELNIEVKGYPASGQGMMYSNGGVHIRQIDLEKPSIYFGTDLNLSTLRGELDRKFAVKLTTVQQTRETTLPIPSVILSLPVPRKYRLSDQVTKWDYIQIISPDSENLRGSVRQGLRRKLRKNADKILFEHHLALYLTDVS